jgi:hypothetical protein
LVLVLEFQLALLAITAMGKKSEKRKKRKLKPARSMPGTAEQLTRISYPCFFPLRRFLPPFPVHKSGEIDVFSQKRINEKKMAPVLPQAPVLSVLPLFFDMLKQG